MLNQFKSLEEVENNIHQSLHTAVAAGLGYSLLRESLADSLLAKFRKLRGSPDSEYNHNLDKNLESKYGELQKKETKKSGQKRKNATDNEAAKDWFRDEFPDMAEDAYAFAKRSNKK